jgi:exodeoxyribonuclease V alpha subunit
MKFDGIVEVTSVSPGSIGGCIFWARAEGQRARPFKIKYNVIVLRNPAVGEQWKIKGQERDYNKYTKQVHVHSAEFCGLPHDDYVAVFLGVHPKFRGFGFGPKLAKNLVGVVGVSKLVKLLNSGDWKTIADTETKVSESQVQRICEEWNDLKEETELVIFLSKNKLDADLAKQIIRLCKFDTVKRLKRNPYALVALSNSDPQSLMTISKVAKTQKINSDDDRTLIGCVEFALYQELERGHTLTELAQATKSIKAYLNMIGSKKSAEIAIQVALAAKAICILEEDETIYLQPISLAYIEQSVEKALASLHKTPIPDNLLVTRDQLPDRIEQYSIEHKNNYGWGLVAKQCEAVEMALTNRVSLLLGYSGTGKTAVLKTIYDIAIEMGVVVHVAALAGKAANRAKQAIGASDKKVSTIHTMIKFIEKGKPLAVDISSDPLLIIDESSMVDIALICKLIKLFGENPFRLLLVGDGAQLPPIGFGLFWHKLIESNAPHTRLTEVHRMLEGSPLHECAMQIRNGQTHDLPLYQGETEGVYVMPGLTDYAAAIVKLRHTFEHCMVLTSYASARFQSSTKTLNTEVQTIINPEVKGEFLMRYGTTSLHKNDPVLATKNSHRLSLFNGMTGVIESIEAVNGRISCHVRFDDDHGVSILSQEDCYEIGLQLAYLITIHKSQGSEYDNCAILIDSPYLERSALYTALTRTKKLCVLIGNNEQYNNAIKRPPSYESIRSGFSPVFEYAN